MPNKKARKKSSSKEKGDIVEEIVAMMHESSGVQVHRDVQVPAAGNNGRTRQFDVLLMGTFAGYESVLVIECKNYGRNINVKDVDSFFGALQDVGYGSREGILVSTSKIGRGAMSRARSLGIKVFELQGLTPDRLSSAIHEARQRIVFTVASISHLVITSAAGEMNAGESTMFFDIEGNIIGTLSDMVWLRWLNGEPPSSLGEHEMEFDTEGWNHRVNEELRPVFSAKVHIKVIGAVVIFPGTATTHALINPDGSGIQKFKSSTSFDPAPGEYPVRVFESETDLDNFLQERNAGVSLTVGRFRGPRIRINNIYWPPSQRVIDRMRELDEAHRTGEGEPLSPETLQGVEGTDLTTLWEPVSSEYITFAGEKNEV